MFSKFRWLICIFLIPLVLSGCSSAVFVDRSNSLVMPNHVARKILAKYYGEEWLDAPYLRTRTNPWCKSEKVRVTFLEITRVHYFSSLLYDDVWLTDSHNVFTPLSPFDGCAVAGKSYTIKVSNESDAKQITEALISLGTPIKGFIKYYAPPP